MKNPFEHFFERRNKRKEYVGRAEINPLYGRPTPGDIPPPSGMSDKELWKALDSLSDLHARKKISTDVYLERTEKILDKLEEGLW